MASRPQLAAVNYTPLRRVSERGACGIDKPLQVLAMNGGAISFASSPTIGCPLAAALDAWLARSVQPAAMAWFGVPVVEVRQIASYACRSINNVPGARLSEHAFGNAIDIAGFTFADGRKVTVKGDYRRGSAQARGFLREVFAAACAQFKTALGPGEPNHEDHFHLDLAHHNAAGTSRHCNPRPEVIRRPAPGPAVASGPVRDAIRAFLDRGFTGSIE
jgi:hypothetical protein